MSTPWLRAFTLAGTVDIEARHSLEETAQRLGEALSVAFEEEQTGRYEEYPAFVATAAGLEFALLGAPAPQYDVRENKTDAHQLMIDSDDDGARSGTWGHAIDVSRYFAELIHFKTGLRCESSEFPATT